jgi:hypothetical protein
MLIPLAEADPASCQQKSNTRVCTVMTVIMQVLKVEDNASCQEGLTDVLNVDLFDDVYKCNVPMHAVAEFPAAVLNTLS